MANLQIKGMDDDLHARLNHWQHLKTDRSAGKELAVDFGLLNASLEKSGSRLDDSDLTIASCALPIT